MERGSRPEFGCTGFGWTRRPARALPSGIDIVAPYGTRSARRRGNVVYIGWNYADGFDPAWIVVIAHSKSFRTWYAHISRGRIDLRDKVKAGQIVGYEGNTGNSTGAHLHWTVEIKGAFANPRLFLAEDGSRAR